MTIEITDEARRAALQVLGRLAEKSIGAAFKDLAEPNLVGKAVTQEAVHALKALLAAGWTPPPAPVRSGPGSDDACYDAGPNGDEDDEQ